MIHPSGNRFDGKEIRWQITGQRRWAYVDAVIYSGPDRKFDFNQSLDLQLAAGIELLLANEEPISVSPKTQSHSTRGDLTATWNLPGQNPLEVRTLGQTK